MIFRKTMNNIIVVTIVLSLLLILGGCETGSPSDSDKENPIKIGAIIDYTGDVAERGPEVEETLKLILEEVNYKVAGRPIELLIEDGGSTVDVSLDKARKLVEVDGVEIIVGPLMGGVQYGVAPYLAENNITFFSLNNLNPAIIEQYENGIGFPSMNTKAYSSGGYYLYDQLGITKIATVGSDYVAGYDYIGSVVAPFKDRGGIVVSEQWAPVGEIDFAPYLSNLINSDAEAVVVFYAGTVSTSLFIQQAKEYNLDMPIIILNAGGSMTAESVQELGTIMDNHIGIDTYTWRTENPTNKTYVESFENKYGKKPITIQTNAYADMMIILAALEKTNGDTSIEALRPAILDLEIDLPHGKYTFTPEGYGVGTQFLMKISENDGEYYWDVMATYFGETYTEVK